MNKSMMKSVFAGAVIVTAGGVFAGLKMGGPEYAEVTRVEPVVETVPKPREWCYDARVTRVVPVTDEDRGAGPLINAFGSGFSANQIDGGDGKEQRVQQHRIVTEIEKKCRTVYDESKQLAGYQVTYRWSGEKTTVLMDRDPGSKLAVKDGQVFLAE